MFMTLFSFAAIAPFRGPRSQRVIFAPVSSSSTRADRDAEEEIAMKTMPPLHSRKPSRSRSRTSSWTGQKPAKSWSRWKLPVSATHGRAENRHTEHSLCADNSSSTSGVKFYRSR